jgi:predicted RNA-binding protein YlxR (DUF448 family)
MLLAKKTRPAKRIPQRTCVGCKTTASQRELIRLVSAPDGVFVNHEGKMAGRGAYLHKRRSCWERGLQGSIGHALKIELSNEDVERLKISMETLPLD